MTVHQKNYLKANWITFANLILLLGIIVQQSQWQQRVDSHIEDTSIHMRFNKKIEVFVPRVELDARMDAIQKTLERIEKKIDN